MLSVSESAAKRCGSHESTAMFAMTRGPSTKPGLRGDEEEARLGLQSAIVTNHWPTFQRPDAPAARDAVEEDGVHRLVVGSGIAWTRR